MYTVKMCWLAFTDADGIANDGILDHICSNRLAITHLVRKKKVLSYKEADSIDPQHCSFKIASLATSY